MLCADIVPQTGPFIANQWMLTGRKMPAAHALQLGLLSQVCKEEELDAATKDYCNELLTSYVLSPCLHCYNGYSNSQIDSEHLALWHT